MSSGMRVLRQKGKTSDELIAKVRGEKRKYQFEMLQAKEVSETESKQTWSLTGRLGKHKRTQKLTRPKTLATQESHVSDKDRKLHKRVIEEVASKLLKLEKGDKNQADSFAKFYQLVTKKGKELAKTYQPKLRAGIKIEVKAIHSVAKDEKDGDVDMKIKIAPNDDEKNLAVDSGRPEELIGEETPKLDKLGEIEKGVHQRYVDDYKQYNGVQKEKGIVFYVESRAARKLGKVGESASLKKYMKEVKISGLSKPSIDVYNTKELVGKETPKLDKLGEIEKGVHQRYVDDYKQYNGPQKKKGLVFYVESRAARKLGKIGESAPLEKSKRRTRIPDIYKEAVVVGDIKDVGKISLDSQMRDNIYHILKGHAAYKGEKKPIPELKRVDLVVRASKDKDPKGTHVSEPLWKAIQATGGEVYELI